MRCRNEKGKLLESQIGKSNQISLVVKGDMLKSLSRKRNEKQQGFHNSRHKSTKGLMREILEDIFYYDPKPFQGFQVERISK